MPEGDTIFRAARTLDRALTGRVVRRFESVFPQLTRVHDDRPLTGRRVDGVEALGKHLLMRFSGDLVLRTHMRMHGSWHVYRPGEPWQRSFRAMRIVVGTDAFEAVAFNVPIAEFRSMRALARDPAVAALGPDLLAATFDEDEAVARLLARPAMSVADALLDQRALAGIGNVFKSEACFEAGIHPHTLVAGVGGAALRHLVRIARRQLRANTIDGSSVPTAWSGLRRTTRSMLPEGRLWVYGRTGRPCRRCGTPIRISRDGSDARSTYWCTVCQPAPAASPHRLSST
jgi:endonuclease-8